MLVTEMQKHGIYYSNFNNQDWIIRFGDIESDRDIMSYFKVQSYINENRFHQNDDNYSRQLWGRFSQFANGFREANSVEQQWLEACERIEKFVEMPKNKEYEVC